jgi:hypothetical protein
MPPALRPFCLGSGISEATGLDEFRGLGDSGNLDSNFTDASGARIFKLLVLSSKRPARPAAGRRANNHLPQGMRARLL